MNIFALLDVIRNKNKMIERMNKISLVCFISIGLLIGCASDKDHNNSYHQNRGEEKNSIVENIMNRRSVRSYKPEQIQQAELDLILECGINAPSARNLQPWAVRVIQSQEIINKLNVDYINYTNAGSQKSSGRFSNYHVLFGAPTFILIAGDTTNAYAHNDCGMLAQNILLASESMDIGSCVLGGIIRFINSSQGDDLRIKLQLPENYQLFIGIVLGYKNEYPKVTIRDKAKIKIIA